MGSGSENHVRLDLPASVAKLGEAELKYSEKEKVIVINSNICNRITEKRALSVVHFSTTWLYSLIPIWSMLLWNFSVVSKILSNFYL